MPIDCEGLIESLPPEVMSTDIVIEQASDITFGGIGFLKQAEAGMSVKELCRSGGFSDATFYK